VFKLNQQKKITHFSISSPQPEKKQHYKKNLRLQKHRTHKYFIIIILFQKKCLVNFIRKTSSKKKGKLISRKNTNK
jgi:hypothetical protein